MKEQHKHFNKAIELLKSRKTISCGELQLAFKIGYNSAGKLMDELENAKIVGPFQGAKARSVTSFSSPKKK